MNSKRGAHRIPVPDQLGQADMPPYIQSRGEEVPNTMEPLPSRRSDRDISPKVFKSIDLTRFG